MTNRGFPGNDPSGRSGLFQAIRTDVTLHLRGGLYVIGLVVSVLLALLPVTATVIGLVALDQRPNAAELAGIALVIMGVFLQEREELARVERTVQTDPA